MIVFMPSAWHFGQGFCGSLLAEQRVLCMGQMNMVVLLLGGFVV